MPMQNEEKKRNSDAHRYAAAAMRLQHLPPVVSFLFGLPLLHIVWAWVLEEDTWLDRNTLGRGEEQCFGWKEGCSITLFPFFTWYLEHVDAYLERRNRFKIGARHRLRKKEGGGGAYYTGSDHVLISLSY